ncbi:sialidase family protein [Sunxiuqinia elliptica]|uniref:exo-alpha-sialidase n=1 Tax=Sunxiuqinia elliptica TaxID=655355 RepID=A0A4R6GVR5_9BACT|nr:sialidase family protein [Sunxiuqinia elliptica]TDN99000.1 sialidase-1 [Sunxiuqinia elliptica]TDO56440.1 sialidase-1 [Sunxiuqinia elliptica]
MKILNLILLFGCSTLLYASCQTPKTSDKPIVQVLWSQADSSHNNYRIPALLVTPQHTLLAFAEGREGGDSGDIDILLRRSTDQGRSWEEQIVVWDDGPNTCGNPCPVVDQTSGRIYLFMTWNLGSDSEDAIIRKQSQQTRIPYLCYSDDDGQTWSEPVSLETTCKDPDWGWYATGPGVGIQLQAAPHKNRLVIPCNNSYTVEQDAEAVKGTFGYGAHVLLSDDGGASWRMSELIHPKVNESQVVELADGTLMMNMRSYHGKSCRAVSYSHDGGESWSAPELAPQLVESVCQASTIRLSSYAGRPLLFVNPAVPHGRTHMSIQCSFDEAKSWSNSKLIYAGPSAYSSLGELPNGQIGLFFEAGQDHPYEKMVFVSFNPDELIQPGTLLGKQLP